MFDRRLLQYFDWGMLGLAVTIGCCGLLVLYSAVTAETPQPQKIIFYKQLIWFAGALVAMVASFSVNYKLLDRWGHVIYFGCIMLLVWVLFFGKSAGGSRRWLILGPFSLQPSELAKIAVMIALARYYSKDANTRGFTLRELFKPVILTLIPFVLIVKQPDLGTAGLILLIAGSITLFVKIERRSLISLIVSFAGIVPRTQNALSFLPEEHTDFIFSVLAEEWGFIGSVIVVLLFLMLIFWGLNTAQGCREPFGTILAVGVTSMFFWQAFINISMTMGLMPVVGVPLPFISYGGSSVLTTAIGIGLLMNISMRRFMID
ncbi:MAG: FtsW/RodA/SpoVE family cell cycle protein [Desulfobacterales bacterium]